MHQVLPLLQQSDFPKISRAKLTTLQINLGYLCNQSCVHCHVNAGPTRKELMDLTTIEEILQFTDSTAVNTLDLTGGAPELNPHFRYLVTKACEKDIAVIDRCNLTILLEPGREDLAEFLADQNVQITASLPCYLEENVDKQRGNGVFKASIEALQRLNELGYGQPDSRLILNLVYNPQGPTLPPDQQALSVLYKEQLKARYGIEFNALHAMANMPINRFGSTLISKGLFVEYMSLLKNKHNRESLTSVMCRYLISVDWQGYVYDCDFNQMLDLSLNYQKKHKRRLIDLIDEDLTGNPISVMDHCYGCTAGQGSSCGGALKF